jgi:hypothetical protein
VGSVLAYKAQTILVLTKNTVELRYHHNYKYLLRIVSVSWHFSAGLWLICWTINSYEYKRETAAKTAVDISYAFVITVASTFVENFITRWQHRLIFYQSWVTQHFQVQNVHFQWNRDFAGSAPLEGMNMWKLWLEMGHVKFTSSIVNTYFIK